MADVLALTVLVVIVVALGAVIWWGSGLPPTRPRPGSRHRGSGLADFERHHRKDERRDR